MNAADGLVDWHEKQRKEQLLSDVLDSMTAKQFEKFHAMPGAVVRIKGYRNVDGTAVMKSCEVVLPP